MFERLIQGIIDFIDLIASFIWVIIIIGLIILVIFVIYCLISDSKSKPSSHPERYKRSTTPKNYRHSECNYSNRGASCCKSCLNSQESIMASEMIYCYLYDIDVKKYHVCDDCTKTLRPNFEGIFEEALKESGLYVENNDDDDQW